jgi:hypothetical protein
VHSFSRIDGPDRSGPAYFLPWKTEFSTAVRFGLIAADDWRCCYRLPDSIVSPSPEACVRSVRELQEDFGKQCVLIGPPSLVIGFSMGTVPATLISNEYGVPLWSFASADRGELMIWSSPAARSIRLEAEQRGYQLADFASALSAINPINCLDNIDPASRFIVGSFDRYVPVERSEPLILMATIRMPRKNVLRLPLGHKGVMLASHFIQRRWMLH